MTTYLIIGFGCFSILSIITALQAVQLLKDIDDRINAIWDDYIDTEIDYLLDNEEFEWEPPHWLHESDDQ